jgi:chloramphenicol 3-O phosphotransferase
MTAEPFLPVAMDAFLDMLPAAYCSHPDDLTFETLAGTAAPTVAIRAGEIAERTFEGMRGAIAALAAAGNNLIVDDVILGAEMEDYRAKLAAFDVRFVGVFAPLAILEERERRRQERMIGLARWQHERVHAGKTCDLGIDTNTMAPEACARLIKEVFTL